MRNLLFLFVLLLSYSTLGQDASIEFTEQSILYRGYHNLVRIIPSENGNVTLVGKNATITLRENGYYIVVPGDGRITELFLIKQSEEKTDTIYSKRYPVVNTPDPTLYWGANASGNTADRSERQLFAKFSAGVPLNGRHRIEKWRVIYGDSEVSGLASDLAGAKEFLAELPKNAVVTVECVVTMPEGLLKKIYGVWTLKD